MSAGTKPALSSFNQNNYKPVSRILYLRMIPEMAIIYLVPSSLAESICQPTGIGRATLRHLLIWHFSTQSLPHINVTITMRRLLPYIFTLTLAGGYFLWHFLYPVFTRPHPLGGALLSAVRTFLPYLRKGDNPACSQYKFNEFNHAHSQLLAQFMRFNINHFNISYETTYTRKFIIDCYYQHRL